MLRQAINSVMNQTKQDWNCIIVDDGSDFNPQEVLDEYKDSRLGLFQGDKLEPEIRAKDNPQFSKNLNSILEYLKDDDGFVVYLCDDDLLFPTWLESVERAYTVYGNEYHCILGKCYYFYDGKDNPWAGEYHPGFPGGWLNTDFTQWWSLGDFTHLTSCYNEGIRWPGVGHLGDSHSWDVGLIETLSKNHFAYMRTADPSVLIRVHDNSLSYKLGRMENGEFLYVPEPLQPEHVSGMME